MSTVSLVNGAYFGLPADVDVLVAKDQDSEKHFIFRGIDTVEYKAGAISLNGVEILGGIGRVPFEFKTDGEVTVGEVDETGNLNLDGVISILGTQVVGTQEVAIDAPVETVPGLAITVNEILTALRNHGLIATGE